MSFGPNKDEKSTLQLNLQLPATELVKRRVSAFPGFNNLVQKSSSKPPKTRNNRYRVSICKDRNQLNLTSASSVPSLEEVIIPERKLRIDNLEKYITSKEKRIPVFGYPIISFHLNSQKEDKIKFLWSLIAKKIISLDTKKCLIKRFLDANKAYRDKESNVFTSFTYGSSPSKSRVSLDETDLEGSDCGSLNSSRLKKTKYTRSLKPLKNCKGKRVSSARRKSHLPYKRIQSLSRYLRNDLSKYSPTQKLKLSSPDSKREFTKQQKQLVRAALRSSIFKPLKKPSPRLTSRRGPIRFGLNESRNKDYTRRLQSQWLPKMKKTKRREKQDCYSTVLHAYS
ncbi:unnamed protein product [Moneuplotes crassus]|uniref:Uncharacterized protein n=1 Tax=Euplotes crassus TaxID=5936 RepID=A0AAD1UN09_EUPCR|nr:unnamed protein product [Moneuplotes crassus]